MSIIRATRPGSHFTMIRNDVIRDGRLSYRARGLLATILSYPDGHSTTSVDLARDGVEGRDAVRTALGELESAGYLCRTRWQDAAGRWRTDSVVSDEPAGSSSWEPTTTEDGLPGVGMTGAKREDLPTKIEPSVLADVAGDASRDVPADAARKIAKGVYDGTAGMVPFVGIMKIAERALKAGMAPEAIQGTMQGLYASGRPITLTTVGQALHARPSGVLEAMQDHWDHGGSFLTDGGGKAT